MKRLTAALIVTNVVLGAAAVYFALRDRPDPIVQAEWLEGIHVDMQAGKINVTVGADGEPMTTIVFTPQSALQAQAELQRTFDLTIESAEALRAQRATADP